ncbi:hypothetical protein [Corynebacterium pseudokroppenstedtii]|uniref:hypothetical protein n=1 Tax=Corynebacterium pseudokroppenstedtii TaxID=2804917 RepID=UPI00307914A6
MKAAFRVLVAGALISEIAVLVLVNTGVGLAGWWALIPIGAVGVALSLLYGSMWRDYRNDEGSWAASLSTTARRFGIPRKALALLVSEVGYLVSAPSIFRPFSGTPDGSRVYTVHKNLRALVFMVLGLSVVEITVVHLAVSHRFWRYLFLIISIYAVILLSGFYASVRNRPHFVTHQGVVIRYGKRLICEIPWSHLRSAKPISAGQGGDITLDENGHLRVPVLSEVNVKLEVEPPVLVEDLHKGCIRASSIEIYCDDRDSFLNDLNER